jgi:hypothetical protein
MEDDFYCISFLSHMLQNRVKFDIQLSDTASNFKQCMFIFTVQMMFIILIGQEIFTGDGFVQCNFDILVTRFICAFLLHIQIEKEVKISLKMIKYFTSHRSRFDSGIQPFLIPFMKLCGSLFTECVNIFLICQQTTIMDCVMNFIALGVIAEIDNLYAARL